jgi:protoheme IX farnesyltransferase
MVNVNAGWLGLMTLVTYILVYTPLKRKTTFNTLVGAVPGALPPLIGYAAARGGLDGESVYLAMIVFFWQMPHFFSLSWIYREDYRKAGYSMLCVIDDDQGSMTSRQINLFVLYLLPVSLAPSFFQFTSLLYLYGASLLGLGFLACSVWLFKGLTDKSARRVFRYSNVYLSVLMILMVVDVHQNMIIQKFDNFLSSILLG